MSQPALFDQPVTLHQLESHLWEAANILHGSPVRSIAQTGKATSFPSFSSNVSAMSGMKNTQEWKREDGCHNQSSTAW